MAKYAVPVNSDELREWLYTPAKFKQIEASGQLPEFIKAYEKSNDNGGKLAQQIAEQTTRVLAQFLAGNGMSNAAASGITPGQQRANEQSLYNKQAPGAKLDGTFSNFADYFRTIWHNQSGSEEERDKLKAIRNAMSSTVPSDGGFLIPEEFRAELLRVSLESAVVRPRARVIPMETLRVGIPTIDATTNNGSVLGGVVTYWTEEGAALVNSQPTFGKVVLEAKKLTAYTEAPNELISDSPLAFNAVISQIYPEAVAWGEDLAFLTGTGVGEPLGIFTQTNAVALVAKETGQATGTIVWENIINMYARMLPGSLSRAVWVASIDTFPQLATMALSVGTGGVPVWLNNGVGPAPLTILGRPVIFTEKTPQLGTQGDLSFVDFGYYLVGDRQTVSVQSSPHYKFGNDVTAFRIIERIDGRPWIQSTITPRNGGNPLSPFVTLAARP